MEANLLKKQHSFGITESENIKVVSVRLVYLVEITDEEYLNEPWLVGTEECQIQSDNPNISKTKKNNKASRLSPAKTHQDQTRPFSNMTSLRDRTLNLDLSLKYSSAIKHQETMSDLYTGLAKIGLNYGKMPDRAPIARRPQTQQKKVRSPKDFIKRQEIYAQLGRKQSLDRQRL